MVLSAVSLLVFATSTLWGTAVQSEETGPQRWAKQIAKFQVQDQQQSPPAGGILFVGSSSIRGWDLAKYFGGLPVINRGFGGSHLEDSVYYADQIILPYKPRVIVVYAGDNDIHAGKGPPRVLTDYRALVDKIHRVLPATRIVFISIKPSIKRWELVERMREANRLIRDVARQDQRLEFVDVWAPMIGEDGKPRQKLFVDDGLHLSGEGYRLWSDLVRPHLEAPHQMADNWSQFRGPRGDGHAPRAQVALQWSESSNVTWKTAVHGRGWSSPVVWSDQIWMTTATEDGKEMFAVCIDRNRGRILHDIKLFDNPSPREKHLLNSYASPTPAVEQDRVYVHFGSYGTACLNSKSGTTIWTRRDLPCHHWRGPGSSLLLYENLLIMHFDGYDYQYVAALDKRTGQTVWKVDRDVEYGTDNGDLMKAYCTPIVIEAAGRKQLISPAAMAVLAYDPYTGEQLWKVRFREHSVTARPLFGHGLLFVNSGFGKAKLLAVRPDGQGDVTDSHVQWIASRGIGSKPSFLLIDDLIYVVHDQGTAACLEAKTGKTVWSQRLGGMYSASPIYANGRIYFFSHEGKTTVIKPGRSFQLLAENQLDDGFMASPAVAGDSLILRTRTHVYRIDG